MKMTTVPEATFNAHIWTLLQEIRRQYLLVGDTNPITITFDHKALGDAMKDHLDLLAQMRKLRIVRLAGDGTFDENNLQAIASIKICNPLFDRVYALYENGNSRQTGPKKLFDMFNILVKSEYKNLKPEVKKFIEGKDVGPSTLRSGEIEYNPTTGKGYHGSKEFTLKDGSPEYRVFSKLYEKINSKVLRYDVLVSAHFYEDDEDIDPVRKGDETAAINKIAKDIRKKVGLTNKQLTMNNGNLTLLGSKPTKPTPN